MACAIVPRLLASFPVSFGLGTFSRNLPVSFWPPSWWWIGQPHWLALSHSCAIFFMEFVVSYPAYRIKKIENRLLHISNSKERKRVYSELSLLKKVIQTDNPYCHDCIFDCLQCSWVSAAPSHAE